MTDDGSVFVKFVLAVFSWRRLFKLFWVSVTAFSVWYFLPTNWLPPSVPESYQLTATTILIVTMGSLVGEALLAVCDQLKGWRVSRSEVARRKLEWSRAVSGRRETFSKVFSHLDYTCKEALYNLLDGEKSYYDEDYSPLPFLQTEGYIKRVAKASDYRTIYALDSILQDLVGERLENEIQENVFRFTSNEAAQNLLRAIAMYESSGAFETSITPADFSIVEALNPQEGPAVISVKRFWYTWDQKTEENRNFEVRIGERYKEKLEDELGVSFSHVTYIEAKDLSQDEIPF